MAFQRSLRSLQLGGITPEARKQRNEAFEALVDLLRPFVAAVAEEKVRVSMKQALEKIKKDITSLPFRQRLFVRLVLLPTMFPGRMQQIQEKVVADEVSRDADVLACALIQTCMDAAKGIEDAKKILDISALDDAMLPPLDHEATESFAESFYGHVIDAADARKILRAVRGTLAEGKVLPDPATDILAASGIVLGTAAA